MPEATSFPKNKIKVLLLESIHENATEAFRAEGFQVEAVTGTVTHEELLVKIADVHFVGVRSRTQLTKEVLHAAKRLMAVGCFCIGTNQVDLKEAANLGIPVFNSPFSNSRSVAELIISHIVALNRKVGDVSREMHAGTWNKSAKGCHEVRGATLGIIGYGHVGSQTSVLAESMGLKVLYYDTELVMPLGNAQSVGSLDELLERSDIVTLHVPLTQYTDGMIGAPQLAKMKPGSLFINYSRGTVVDLDALAAALTSGHLRGAAVDVFPKEPRKNGPGFESPLRNTPNCILTPHIGGSTLEAQAAIADEVSGLLIKYCNRGATVGSVNFPEVAMQWTDNTHRVLNIHRNVPGVLRAINNITSDFNIEGQTLRTKNEIGYVIIDVDKKDSGDLEKEFQTLESMSGFDANIRTRVLY